MTRPIIEARNLTFRYDKREQNEHCHPFPLP